MGKGGNGGVEVLANDSTNRFLESTGRPFLSFGGTKYGSGNSLFASNGGKGFLDESEAHRDQETSLLTIRHLLVVIV